MVLYTTEEETKALTKIDEKDSNNTVIIPAFDIHSKNVGNKNGAGRIVTNAYEFRCHLDNSNIFKALLKRCSKDINNAFNFIPFGLPQLTTIATYRHYIKLQNNYLASTNSYYPHPRSNENRNERKSRGKTTKSSRNLKIGRDSYD